MKRTRIQNRCLTICLMLMAMLLSSVGVKAQNVTIKATNGSTIAAVKNGGTTDTFFGLGGFATWQHEQLCMVLTVSDGTDLTPNGQLDNPANNLFASGDYMQIAKGKASGANVCYATLSLPKGYRFTGYTIKFTKPRNAQNSEFNTGSAGSDQSTFGETNSTFATYTTQATIAINGTAQTITRTEMNEGDMSNVLYFMLQNPSSSRALIQLESAEFFFTAEENYSPVTPAGVITSPVSAVDVPFSTSKVDFGPITSRTYNGSTRVSYSSASVTDLEAKFVLYEGNSIEDGSDIDDVAGKIVKYGSGTISSNGGYFKLGSGDDDVEQIYYIESPTYVELSNGTKNPVGYRIVGAEFEYTTDITGVTTFYIKRVGNSGTYYLNTDGRFTTTPVIWEMDNEGYISSGGRYLYFNNTYAATQTTKPGTSERFAIDNNGNIYQIEYPTYFICYYRQGQTRYGQITNVTNNNTIRATADIISSVSGTSVDNFTLNVYDKTGVTPHTINVTGHGKYEIPELMNNDAVKFGVKGTGLVRATLTLQALDPYLDQMQVVCQDQVQTAIRMTQTFTASDFSVSGGKFYFYLPSDCNGHQVLITFEDLKSKYFDESYTGGSASHTSRINFVKSAHYNAFGASNNKIYNNVSEAANAQLERLKVGTVGTAKFKFNNADEVGTSGGTLTEYPFSLEKYAASPNNGSFTNMQFTVSSADQGLTRYVFTTDETRYNIAPTTATQHRAYAYYEMEVHVQSGLYEPKVEFKKIYNNTLYGTGQTDAFYGAVITAVDGNGKPGYSSMQEIYSMMNRCINTDKVDDFGHTDIPDNVNKLLYLDYSQLAGVYEGNATGQQSGQQSATFAANCITFVPVGSSSSNNNVAYKMESGGFMAANDIIFTDKEPFYTPYDIQVHSANKAVYKRLITKDKYGKVQNASLILPFVITVDDSGTHTNLDGSKFSLHTMQSTAALTQIEGKTYAYFPELSKVTITEANKPYLVKLDANSSEDGVSFVVSQNGTLIKATTAMAASDYTFTGATSTGTATGGDATGDWSFTSKGTYAGAKIAKAANVFYFARNQFVNSGNLSEGYEYANIAPFRAYFATGRSSGAKLSGFDIIFEEGFDHVGIATGMQAINAAELIDVNAPVYDMQGRMVANSYRELANKSKKLQSGLYVVNGVKFMIK